MPSDALRYLARGIWHLSRPPRATRPRRIVVIGAGTMGAGIASALLPVAEVTLVDPEEAALAHAAGRAQRHLRELVRAGRLPALAMRRVARRLSTSTAWPGTVDFDLAIEAVPERLPLKRELLRSYQPLLPAHAVWATATSAMPVHEIAAGAPDASRVVGMHFLPSVERSALVEIVADRCTAPGIRESLRLLALVAGKTPLVVRDSPGFLTTRVLSAFFAEALRLVTEGVPVRTIDAAAERFGFVRGPLRMLDAIGLDVAADVGRFLARYGTADGSDPLATLVRAGMLGRKNGEGFYRYDGTRMRPNPVIAEVLGGGATRSGAATDATHRLVYAFVNETARAMAKRIAPSDRDADVGCVLGLGFPARRGGPLLWAARRGHARLSAELHSLAGAHGPRFSPSARFHEVKVGA